MLRSTLNLGILAHVDAGKTTLTERLLHAAGVIGEIGSVDDGTTRTDSLALEQQRGITIKSAVVSFPVDDVTVNLIDTPGHPDFIAEVERALSVLDGAVLVISAVEGVQPQTLVLMRALRRLRVPTLLFVNKIDRMGADYDRVLDVIARRLAVDVVPMGSVVRIGTPDASFVPGDVGDSAFRTSLIEALAGRNDRLLAAYVEDENAVTYEQLRTELAAQSRQALVHPVFFGSAVTGSGVDVLMAALTELLPAAAGADDGPVSGRIFKIERGPAGEKVAYVRMFTGAIRTRDRLHFGDAESKVTAINAFDEGTWLRRDQLTAGEIGKLWGLADGRIGDPIGDQPGSSSDHQFAPPTLETVVVPTQPGEKAALRAALTQLAEQDPLINVRQDDTRAELSISLYGEVQKEVIEATLATEFGLEITYRETTPICVERPAASGEAIEHLHGEGNPFLATIGLRVEPAPVGSGIEFRLGVDFRSVPLYAYRNLDSFADAMAGYVRGSLREGLYGWQVADCVVTMYECVYSSPDGPPSTRGPLSSPGDFRRLTPIVMMRALEQAGTEVCEPVVRAGVEAPTGSIGAVLSVLARLGAVVEGQSPKGELARIQAVLPAARVRELQRQLPRLTGGEGVLESSFAGYQAVGGHPPTRRRTTANPLNRDEYLLELRVRNP